MSNKGLFRYTQVVVQKVVKVIAWAVLIQVEDQESWVPKSCILNPDSLRDGDLYVVIGVLYATAQKRKWFGPLVNVQAISALAET